MSEKIEHNGHWWSQRPDGLILYWENDEWKPWYPGNPLGPPPEMTGGIRTSPRSPGNPSPSGESIVRTRAWIARHPYVTSGAALVLGFFVGVGSAAPEGSSTLESALASAEANVDAAHEENEGLEERLASLEDDNEALDRELGLLSDKLDAERSKRDLPDFSGQSRESVEALAAKFGWDLRINKRSSDMAPGTVISQSPAAGTEVSDGSNLSITIAKPPPAPPPVEEPPAEESSGTEGCTPGYTPCLPPASDYDCEGGSGDGPAYTGYVTVTGSDPYGLDSDGDGTGCE